MLQKLRTLDNSHVLQIMLDAFTIAFLVGAFCAPDRSEILPGLFRILTNSAILTKDYFYLEIGSISGACLNAGLVGIACCALTYLPRAKTNGNTVSAYFLTVGFSFYGMNIINILPYFLGVFLYAKIKRERFAKFINLAMYSTALGPLASEMLLCYPDTVAHGVTMVGFLQYLAVGIVTGLCMQSLCEQSRRFHLGFNLYNAGPAAGFLCFLMYAILYETRGIPAPPIEATLGTGDWTFVNVFCIVVFAMCILFGFVFDKEPTWNYGKLFFDTGFNVDFSERYGPGPCVINFGVYGLFILGYYNLIGATFTGPTFGAIWCMLAWCSAGATPLNVFPIMIGYYLGSLFGVTPVNSQAMVVGLCFASGLAPVSGEYGIIAGTVAGFLHYCIVTSVPAIHGGFNLYNGGFTAGLVCFVLIPVLRHYFETRDEHATRLAEQAKQQQPGSGFFFPRLRHLRTRAGTTLMRARHSNPVNPPATPEQDSSPNK